MAANPAQPPDQQKRRGQHSSHGIPSLQLASSNGGKLREYRALAGGASANFDLDLMPNFSAIPAFEELAPTFAENAAGKAIYYSRLAAGPDNTANGMIIADDSGLCVTALGDRPGVYSARYAGPNASSAARISKLLGELRDSRTTDRSARFVCVLALALQGRILAVISDSIAGEILEAPRGDAGFGYDPIFLFPTLGKTFAELPPAEKNLHSHRGRAFRKLLHFLSSTAVL